MAKNVPIRLTISIQDTSVLDPDDLADPQGSDALQEERAQQHPHAHRIGNQDPRGVWRNVELQGADRWRQGGENDRRHPTMRGNDLDLSLDLESLTDHRRQVVEDAREVAAGLALR